MAARNPTKDSKSTPEKPKAELGVFSYVNPLAGLLQTFPLLLWLFSAGVLLFDLNGYRYLAQSNEWHIPGWLPYRGPQNPASTIYLIFTWVIFIAGLPMGIRSLGAPGWKRRCMRKEVEWLISCKDRLFEGARSNPGYPPDATIKALTKNDEAIADAFARYKKLK